MKASIYLFTHLTVGLNYLRSAFCVPLKSKPANMMSRCVCAFLTLYPSHLAKAQ